MFKKHSAGMSFRIFRSSARKNLILARRPIEPTLFNMGDLEPLCEGLSQENLENVSIFRGDVNMLRAEQGEEAIKLAVAMKYLKATRYNAMKALDIYKNYQKYRETYHLDNLKVHREPLCSEIGTKKLEILGTYDADGSPLIVFTAAKHEIKHSDSKAAMQLLFYILDQAAESEHSLETGIVFLLDLRDASLTCTSYLIHILSVLRDGYPLYVKGIYFIDAPQTIRKTPGVARLVKQEKPKVHHISFSELSSYFDPSQLPLTLGGTYTPGKEPTYPFCALKATCPMAQRNRIQRSEGGRTVNSLAQMFDKPKSSGNDPAESRKSPPSHMKPLPPTPQRLKPTTAAATGQGKPAQSNSPHPPKKVSYHGKPHSNGHPPAPPSKPGAPKSLVKQPLCATNSDPDILAGGRGDHSPNQPTKGVGVASRIQNWNHGIFESKPSEASKPSQTAPVSDKSNMFIRNDSEDLLTASWSPSNSRQPRGRAGSDGQSNRSNKPLVPIQVIRSNGSNESTAHSSETKQPLLPPPNQGGRAPEKKKTSVSYENQIPRQQSKSFDRSVNSDYENIDTGAPNSRIHQTSNGNGSDIIPIHYSKGGSPHHIPQSYENISLASPTHQLPSPPNHHPPPSSAPPAPPAEYAVVGLKSTSVPAVPVRTSDYEEVNFTPKHSRPMDDGYASDDDTLFGQEGPPGLQLAIYENFGPDKGNRLMSVEELEKHISTKGIGGLGEEYIKIKNEPLSGPYTSCRLKCNTPKNRYKDVICYEDSRVKLQKTDGVEGSDYIHANYVSGYNKPEAFILTQGPKDKTVCDFWRMVWEKQVHLIVMVTRCVEMMKRKCAQYWPESTGTSVKHGNVTVEVVKVKQLDGFEQRTMKISTKGGERTVIHFQFVAWPDYGVPSNGKSVLNLLFAAREAQAKITAKHRRDFKHSYGPPIVVHCSAGVGRSGAFCALDTAIDELADKKKVNLQGIVRKMRLQRAYAIQTGEQYEFCYRTLLEYAKTHR